MCELHVENPVHVCSTAGRALGGAGVPLGLGEAEEVCCAQGVTVKVRFALFSPNPPFLDYVGELLHK